MLFLKRNSSSLKDKFEVDTKMLFDLTMCFSWVFVYVMYKFGACCLSNYVHLYSYLINLLCVILRLSYHHITLLFTVKKLFFALRNQLCQVSQARYFCKIKQTLHVARYFLGLFAEIISSLQILWKFLACKNRLVCNICIFKSFLSTITKSYGIHRTGISLEEWGF